MAAPIYQFAGFRLDCGNFELRRNGTALRVERMPLELLILLVSRAGHLVTREEISQHLWSSEVFVDTDRGINTAIRKIRYALRDDPETPRILLTVKSKGYRIICPVESMNGLVTAEVMTGGSVPSSEADAAGPTPQQTTLAQTPPVQLAATDMLRKSKWRPGRVVFISLAAILLVATAWFLLRPLPPPRITAYNRITRDGHFKDLGGTDGSRVFFTQYSPSSIAQVAVTGGEVSQVPVPVYGNIICLYDVSPDGSSFLVGSGDQGNPFDNLWDVRIMSGSVRYLGRTTAAVFSPDGNWLAYAVANDGIYVMHSNGTERRKVAANSEARPASLSWSPDGKAIQFEQADELWEVSHTGGGLHRFIPNWRAPGDALCCGRWTADGHFFLFGVLGTGPAADQIWALDRRRRLPGFSRPTPIQLTSQPLEWKSLVTGTDATKIFAVGSTRRGELTRYDEGKKFFSPFLAGISAEFVTYSSDGRSVLYVSYPDGILWKANRDGSSPVQLTEDGVYPITPRWSPDGTQIVFCVPSRLDEDVSYIVSAEGGIPRRIVPKGAGDQRDPNWSPDGKSILYEHGATTPEKSNLLIVNLGEGRVYAVPGSSGLFSPRWSRDGRYIAALASTAPSLRLFDFQTQQWRALPVQGSVDFPSFSSDGQLIYFFRRKGRDQGVYRIRLNGHEPERVVDLKDWHLTGHFSFWLGLDPSDSPLQLRDIGSSDIYKLTLEP